MPSSMGFGVVIPLPAELVVVGGGESRKQHRIRRFIFSSFKTIHALKAAVRFLPYLLVAVAFNLGSDYLLSKVKYMPPYLISGVLITIGGSFLYIYLKPETSTAIIYSLDVILAVGVSLTMQIGYTVATLKVDPDDVANSLSMQNVSQMGGTTIALIISVLAFKTAAVRNVSSVLAGQGFTKEQIQAAVAGAQSALFEQLSIDTKAIVILELTKAMQAPFILVIISGAVLSDFCSIHKNGEAL